MSANRKTRSLDRLAYRLRQAYRSSIEGSIIKLIILIPEHVNLVAQKAVVPNLKIQLELPLKIEKGRGKLHVKFSEV
jgi:hypothetical protein